jgi:hypothetical protein
MIQTNQITPSLTDGPKWQKRADKVVPVAMHTRVLYLHAQGTVRRVNFFVSANVCWDGA